MKIAYPLGHKPFACLLLSVLATLSLHAVAAVDLDATSPNSPVYARETLTAASLTTGTQDGVDYYNVTDAGSDIDIVSRLGVGLVVDGRLYIRYTFSNGVLAAGHGASLVVDSGNADVVLSLGGATGDNFIVFAVTATALIDQTAAVELSLDRLAIGSSGAVGVSYELYSTASEALFEDSAFYRRELATYITTAASASASFTPGTNTADVDRGFLGFTSASISELRANVGSLEYKTVTGTLAAGNGLQVTLGDIVNELGTTLEFQGDFSFGNWYLDADSNCASPDATLLIDAEDSSMATATLRDVGSNGYHQLCVEVNGETDEIVSGEYLASATPGPLFAAQLFSAARFSGAVGVIELNGTVVNMPNLTTFSDYRQRITLVNHRDLPVDYSFSFTPEEGVFATPLDAASGTLPPNTTVVLQVTDVVVLTGGNRCAATLAADARVGAVTVSTTQVNVSNGSTDTVVY